MNRYIRIALIAAFVAIFVWLNMFLWDPLWSGIFGKSDHSAEPPALRGMTILFGILIVAIFFFAVIGLRTRTPDETGKVIGWILAIPTGIITVSMVLVPVLWIALSS